jgi:PAS domain S-box-containing protein
MLNFFKGLLGYRKRFEYIEKLNNIIISQLNNPIFYTGDVVNGAKELTKQVSISMNTERCSIWLYNEDKTSIKCQQLYIKSDDTWYTDIELFEKDFIPYFEALKKGIIVASDAINHDSTKCFKEAHLDPLGILSMLDVPIVYRGEIIGVICIESLTKREWNKTEINFAQMLSSFYSFSHLIKEDNITNSRIKEISNFIDKSSIVSRADKFGKITYVNEKFIEVSGYNLEEVVGKDHSIVNSGFHSKDFWTDMYKTTVKDKNIWNNLVTNRAKDGSLYFVDTYIKALFDEYDQLYGYMSIRQDITKLKNKEQELFNRMNAINKSSAVIEFDLDGKIMYANDLFCKLMGYKGNEIKGKHHRMFLTEDDANSEEYKTFWSRLRSGEIFSERYRRVSSKGSVIWLQATYNPIKDLQGNVYKVMKIAQDITESMENVYEIEKKNTYLEHAAKIIRHDMHSGINTYIPRGVSSLERRLSEDDIKSLKIESPLKMVKEGLKHAQKVYKGVYEFTNLVKKDAVLNKSKCNIKFILHDYLSSTSYISQVYLDDNLPDLEVNESLFCTSIDNLIRNGLKYNDSDKKFVKVYSEDGYVVVQDNGRGMTQEDFDKLSQPYTRKEGQKESGTGLGLNICIAILHEHGFSLTCEKLETGGTKIKIKVNND